MTAKPILKYPGAKWLKADWIVSHFPEHRIYIEPYCGSAACFFTKAPSELEILNDLSHNIVNLFRIMRERGEELASLIELTPLSREEYDLSYDLTDSDMENARRFLVRCWQAHGARMNGKTGWWHEGVQLEKGSSAKLWNKLPERIRAVLERLKDAQIEQRPALDVIARYNASHTLLYVDPPYVLSTRHGRMYAHEMSDTEHLELIGVLKAFRGMVVLSGYDSPLYTEHLEQWYQVRTSALAEHGKVNSEVLWFNPKAVQSRQLSLFESEVPA